MEDFQLLRRRMLFFHVRTWEKEEKMRGERKIGRGSGSYGWVACGKARD
jgi:hypothetical protein